MTDNQDIQKFIEHEVKSNPIVLFMKGSKLFPQCGFSGRVVSILSTLDVEFVAHDVLQSERLRQGIKDYTGWPTIPQLFINGEFIGGCDIVIELAENGELEKLIKAQE